ncbi:hypothetical protein, partial [Deinococcus sp. SL84]|uniref:hypothetical protein n=1 Tax=Deinococcus sp. SL84 TaxID=2994663 RepID=UPI00227487D9
FSEIGLRGILLDGVPLTIPLNHQEKTGEVLANLIEGGLLPALPPELGETVDGYLTRLSKVRGPLERDLSLVFTADERRQFPYQLTGYHRVSCEAHELYDLGHFLNARDPRLLPSLLLAIHAAEHPAWPVYTVTNTVNYLSERYWWGGPTFQDGFRAWILEELELDGEDVDGTLSARQEEIHDTHPYNPANVRAVVGEVTFDICTGTSTDRLSMDELWAWSAREPFLLPEILSRIAALAEAAHTLSQAEPHDWNNERYNDQGEGIAPLAAFSFCDPKKTKYKYNTLEREVLEEEHQMYMMGEGHCPQLWANVATTQDIALARELIPLHGAVYEATNALILTLLAADNVCSTLEEA